MDCRVLQVVYNGETIATANSNPERKFPATTSRLQICDVSDDIMFYSQVLLLGNGEGSDGNIGEEAHTVGRLVAGRALHVVCPHL